ncbi:MAG: hypothetical protein ACI8QS_002019 [Planctomycetota bacterium]|jgi:hypothetical protein
MHQFKLLRRLSASSLTLLLSVGCLLSTGCIATNQEPDPQWHETELEAPNDRLLWKIGLQACDKMGFPMGAGLDASSMIIKTSWRTNLQPFRGEGTRERAEVRMLPQRRGLWAVQVRVEQQRNMALARPLDPAHADWKWMRDDVVSARILTQHLRSYLEPDIDPVDRPDDPIEAYLLQNGLSD